MSARPFIPDRALSKALARALGPAPLNVLAAAPSRVVAALGRAGHSVTAWRLTRATVHAGQAEGAGPVARWEGPLDQPPAALERYGALVLVDALGHRDDPLADVRNLVRRAQPGARLALVEQAAWGSGGRWVSRLLGRITGRALVMDASELNALCLNAGLVELRQTWPQGLRSLVLTTGRVHRLASLLD